MSFVIMSTRLSPETKRGLEEAAKVTGRSQAYVMRLAVDKFLEARVEKQDAIEAALKQF